jgi:hypothetical protein
MEGGGMVEGVRGDFFMLAVLVVLMLLLLLL